MDRQICKFIARISENLPDMSGEVMQRWIDNPKSLQRALKDVLCPHESIRSWREEDGVIYFSVESVGTTGEEWIRWFDGRGYIEEDCALGGGSAHEALRSPDFKPTNGVKTEVVVLKGAFFGNNNLVTNKICAEADRRKLSKPNAELACLILEKFAANEIKAMGLLFIVAMHEPINDINGVPCLLEADYFVDVRQLKICHGGSASKWRRDGGFAFVVSST